MNESDFRSLHGAYLVNEKMSLMVVVNSVCPDKAVVVLLKNVDDLRAFCSALNDSVRMEFQQLLFCVKF